MSKPTGDPYTDSGSSPPGSRPSTFGHRPFFFSSNHKRVQRYVRLHPDQTTAAIAEGTSLPGGLVRLMLGNLEGRGWLASTRLRYHKRTWHAVETVIQDSR